MILLRVLLRLQTLAIQRHKLKLIVICLLATAFNYCNLGNFRVKKFKSKNFRTKAKVHSQLRFWAPGARLGNVNKANIERGKVWRNSKEHSVFKGTISTRTFGTHLLAKSWCVMAFVISLLARDILVGMHDCL